MNDFNWKHATDVLLKIISPILLGMCGWLALRVIDHEVRLASIESSRYTRKDASEAKDKLYGKLDAIKESVISLERKVPSKDEMTRVRDSISKLSDKIDDKK